MTSEVKRSRATRGAGTGACGECSRPSSLLRRGKCPACYMRERRGAVTADACAVCSERDRRVLVLVTFEDGPATLCANHAQARGKRRMTLDAFRAEERALGERRSGDRRSRTERRRAVSVAWALSGEPDRRGEGRRASDAA